jgi:CRP-like cAMP-binding protein
MSELQPGDQLGEIALLHDAARNANVKAASPAITSSQPRDAFVGVSSRVLAGCSPSMWPSAIDEPGGRRQPRL